MNNLIAFIMLVWSLAGGPQSVMMPGPGMPASTAAAPIAYVNAASAVTTGSHTTLSAPAIDVAAGNLLHVLAKYYNSTCATTTVTITDTGSANTFTMIGAQYYRANVGCTAQFYAKNTAAVTGDVITANFSPARSYDDIVVLQFSGANTTAPLDQSDAAQGYGTTATSGSFTPGATGEVAVAVIAVEAYGYALSAGTNYTMPAAAKDGGYVGGEYRLNAPASSQTSTGGIALNDWWTLMTATYKQ